MTTTLSLSPSLTFSSLSLSFSPDPLIPTFPLVFVVQVKNIRDWAFYDIVPVEELLVRLEADARRPLMCSAMTQLLLNSFFGSEGDEAEAEQLRRCLEVLRVSPQAAAAFYAHLHTHTSVQAVVKHCALLFNFIIHQLPGMMDEAEGDVVATSKSGKAKAGKGKRRRAREVGHRPLCTFSSNH